MTDICRLSESSFVPRWKKLHNDSDKCAIPECDKLAYKVTNLSPVINYVMYLLYHISRQERTVTVCAPLTMVNFTGS